MWTHWSSPLLPQLEAVTVIQLQLHNETWTATDSRAKTCQPVRNPESCSAEKATLPGRSLELQPTAMALHHYWSLPLKHYNTSLIWSLELLNSSVFNWKKPKRHTQTKPKTITQWRLQKASIFDPKFTFFLCIVTLVNQRFFSWEWLSSILKHSVETKTSLRGRVHQTH